MAERYGEAESEAERYGEAEPANKAAEPISIRPKAVWSPAVPLWVRFGLLYKGDVDGA